MAKKEEGTPEVISQVDVTVHLDRDPNDPRNVAETPSLPSLDDEDQK